MKKIVNTLLAGIIIVGLLMLSYAIYEHYEAKKLEEVSLQQIKKELEIKDKEKDKSERSIEKKPIKFSPREGESIGVLHIPKIEGELPIIEGTEPDALNKGVGHFNGTAYPTQDNQIVLSGHRDTVFRRIGELELGDILTVEMFRGSYDYEIVKTHITDAEDRTVIVPHDEEILTVTTCYPFNYIGHAPDRYIITAKPINRNYD